MGADDYIKKPFSQRLPIERIRALLRRGELAVSDADDPSGGAWRLVLIPTVTPAPGRASRSS